MIDRFAEIIPDKDYRSLFSMIDLITKYYNAFNYAYINIYILSLLDPKGGSEIS